MTLLDFTIELILAGIGPAIAIFALAWYLQPRQRYDRRLKREFKW